MNNDSLTMEQPSELEHLRRLLEEQLRHVKKSNFRDVEQLLRQADSVIQKITEDSLSADPEYKQKIGYILDLYQKMELMLEAEKELTNKHMQKVTNGKKTIRAYQH